jgi:hypothetical protein
VAREAAADHVAGCVRCAGIFKAARAAARVAVSETSRAEALPRPAILAPRFAAAMATLAVAIAAVVVMRQGAGPSLVPAEPTARPAATTTAPPADPLAALRIEKPPVVVSAERLLATRGGTDQGYIEALARALEPYRRDDFGEAAVRLSALGRSRPDAFEPGFYLGVTLLLDAKASDAVPHLERALKLAGGRRDDASFYLALARIQCGQREPARAALAELCGAKGTRAAEACLWRDALSRQP